LETIAPASLPLPAAFGGEIFDPTSSGAPSPMPLRPVPVPDALAPPPTDGGGGTTLAASEVPPFIPALPPVVPEPPPGVESEGGGGTTLGFPRYGAAPGPCREFAPPATPTEGGGATTLDPRDAPVPRRFPEGLPAGLEPINGAGGTTFAEREGAAPLFVPLASTEGGGGTTSCVPKIFPISELTRELLPVCCGGGGTTP